MDTKKRNIFLICTAIFIGSYIARSFYINYLRMVYAQQQAVRKKPKPVPTDNPVISPLAAEAAALGNFSGLWSGHGAAGGGRGLCDLRLEMKQNDPGHYTGYSRFSCLPTEALTGRMQGNPINNMVNRLGYDAAILTGVVEKGAIHLHTDKTIGTDINGCTVSEITITPFGASAVAVEWKEGECQGGSLMMTRTGR